MKFNDYLNSVLMTGNLNICSVLDTACKIIEENNPVWEHNMTQWFSVPSYDRLERKCYACNLTQALTGQNLSFATSSSKFTLLLEDLFQTSQKNCPAVSYAGSKASPIVSVSPKALAHIESLINMGVITQETAYQMLQIAKNESSNPPPAKDISWWQTQINQASAPMTQQVMDEVYEKLKTEFGAAEVTSVTQNYPAEMWKHVEAHVKYLNEQIEPPDFEATNLPEQIDPPKPWAPEFTDSTLDEVIQWLEKPRSEFSSDPWSWKNLQLLFAPESTVTGHVLAEGEVPGPETLATVDYFVVIIHRETVILPDQRWWMEIAVRQDTGEPVATVNHQGSFHQYMEDNNE